MTVAALQERQRLLEQQRQAEAGKALLAKQAALFKKMISRVMRGARSSRDGQGDGEMSGPNVYAGGGSMAGEGAAGQRAESPVPDPLLATMPALGGRNSRPPTRPVSSRIRPRQQRRLIVQASARWVGGCGHLLPGSGAGCALHHDTLLSTTLGCALHHDAAQYHLRLCLASCLGSSGCATRHTLGINTTLAWAQAMPCNTLGFGNTLGVDAAPCLGLG